MGKAHPRIVEVVETMLKKGKWTVPGMLLTLCFKKAELRTSVLNRLQGEVWGSQCHVNHCFFAFYRNPMALELETLDTICDTF